jgi:hypothetical protein
LGRCEVLKITIPESILDIDLKKLIRKIEVRYNTKLPRTVIALDYGSKGDLYIRFKHSDNPVG